MYKVLTSLWSRSSTSTHNKTRLSSITSSDLSINEDDWVLISDNISKVTLPNESNSMITDSWIASPPLMKTDDSTIINRSSSPTTHHFNPIENLLIEHASMSVYEQIASRTRSKRHRKPVKDIQLEEQVEEIKDNDDDDDDGRSSVVLPYSSQHPNLTSIHHRNLNGSLSHSINSSVSALESSTSSLMAHQRHLNRIHQRRRRSVKTSTKLILSNTMDESKLTSNKVIERQRVNCVRTPKFVLHQPSRSNH